MILFMKKEIKEQEKFTELVEIIRRLRAPDGCPWDRAQTLYSMKDKLIEEAYEVYEAILQEDNKAMREEFGDLLLHVVMHAIIAEDSGDFTLSEVIETVSNKLVTRHPHVFGDSAKLKEAGDVEVSWEELKGKEDKKRNVLLLDRVSSTIPPLEKSYIFQSKISNVGFKWENLSDIVVKLKEEIEELETAINANDLENIKEEIGDSFAILTSLSNHLDISPVEAVNLSNEKIRRRFNYIQEHLQSNGREFKDSSLQELESLWNKAKEELDK